MTKAAKKVAKKTGRPSAATSRKETGQPAPRMSGAEIEKLLAGAHKTIATAGFAINAMLTKRRLNLRTIEETAEAVAAANETMRLLLTSLRGP